MTELSRRCHTQLTSPVWCMQFGASVIGSRLNSTVPIESAPWGASSDPGRCPFWDTSAAARTKTEPSIGAH
jgi:hypothetical protein